MTKARFHKTNTSEKKQPTFFDNRQKYFFQEVPEHLRNRLMFNGDILLIHAAERMVQFWTPRPDLHCNLCGKPYYTTACVIGTNFFNENWCYTNVIYAGGFPACHCKPEKWHYTEAHLAHDPAGNVIEKDEIEGEDNVGF